jgi:hypothetical protein
MGRRAWVAAIGAVAVAVAAIAFAAHRRPRLAAFPDVQPGDRILAEERQDGEGGVSYASRTIQEEPRLFFRGSVQRDGGGCAFWTRLTRAGCWSGERDGGRPEIRAGRGESFVACGRTYACPADPIAGLSDLPADESRVLDVESQVDDAGGQWSLTTEVVAGRVRFACTRLAGDESQSGEVVTYRDSCKVSTCSFNGTEYEDLSSAIACGDVLSVCARRFTCWCLPQAPGNPRFQHQD